MDKDNENQSGEKKKKKKKKRAKEDEELSESHQDSDNKRHFTIINNYYYYNIDDCQGVAVGNKSSVIVQTTNSEKEVRKEVTEYFKNQKAAGEMTLDMVLVGMLKYLLFHKVTRRRTQSAQIDSWASSEGVNSQYKIRDPDEFLQDMNHFRKGNYVLLTCKNRYEYYLESLAMIPWFAVYDFDEKSREDGLLSIVEEKIKSLRALYICTWNDKPKLADYSTMWCLIRGSTQEANSRTPNDPKQWSRQVRKEIEYHLEELVRNTEMCSVLKIVVIWPDNEDLIEYLHKFIGRMEEIIDPQPTIILVDSNRNKSTVEGSIIEMMKPNYTLYTELGDLCHSIRKSMGKAKENQKQLLYQLKTSSGDNDPKIDEAFASSLRENLEVLYLNTNPYGKTSFDIDEIKEEEDRFFRGANLRWFAYYECGAGHFDAERDITIDIVDRILNGFVKQYKSGFITLFHAPGAGGTTLAQRVLWDLSRETPCAKLILTFRSKLNDIARQIEALYEKTHLPIVLLIDGVEEHKAKFLMNSLEKPENEQKAECCYQKALELCNASVNRGNDEIEDSMKHTLMHVYHMYGMFYVRKISKFTGRDPGEEPRVRTAKNEFETRAGELLQWAIMACDLFSNGRKKTPLGSEQSYGYIGEIRARLHICDFVLRHVSFKTLADFMAKSNDQKISDFVKESCTFVIELIMECFGVVDSNDLGREFYRIIDWYNKLFQNKYPRLDHFGRVEEEDTCTRRLKASLIKMKYSVSDNYHTIDNITSTEDLAYLVELFEANMRDSETYGVENNRRAIDLDYKDWMFAIRSKKYPRTYSVEDVLIKVRQWHYLLNSPTSTYYLFVLLSILGFGMDYRSGNSELLMEANDLKDSLKIANRFKRMSGPRIPWEWLGVGDGIRCLIPNQKVPRHDDTDKNKPNPNAPPMLARLKGTISRPNDKVQSGFITLDLGQNPIHINAFFVPIRTKEKLVGQAYAGRRVEFALGFSISEGYGAYEVFLLKRIQCSKCKRGVEIKSDEDSVPCHCGQILYKELCSES
ncbi:hypothetical protein KUTeg_018965 [Tegillarca granosa]|uniref:Uncharacterized protein n=1 Tax=Tegillarca granosa TaxID=220873 RepID=A0ABQ9EB50_TEGGR|nr:hypothetical protein KUTeg_018965 [Tegillarca granosa]